MIVTIALRRYFACMSMAGGWIGKEPLRRVALRSEGDGVSAHPHVSALHGLASCMSDRTPLPALLASVVDFAGAVVRCDSCFLYIVEGDELVLGASRNSHPEALGNVRLKLGQGITGWVAAHREPVVLSRNAASDARFKRFNELPEDRFEAFLSVPLLSRGRVIGVINLQNRDPHEYSEREVTLLATMGLLVGAEIEMARVEREMSELSSRLEQRKVVERAKGILQRDLAIGENEAYVLLQRQSQQRRRPMKDIAEAVILSRMIRDEA